MIDISVITVGYNTADLIDECITSIKRETSCAYEIIIIDNDSSDGTVEMLKEKHPDVICIANNVNVGFGSACNQGLEIAKGRFPVLLNPDTVVLDGALDKMLEFMEQRPDAGFCAPANVGPDMHLQRTCHHFPTLMGRLVEYAQLRRLLPTVKMFGKANMTYWDYNDIRAVDWASGSCLMINRKMIDGVGVFDPEYFLYVEEVDWCLRASKKGWPTMFYPDAKILHHSGASAEKAVSQEELSSKSISHLLFRSQYYYFKKHKGFLYSWAVRCMDFFYALLLYTKNLVWAGKNPR
ncbi:MAG: glycosyltransferase family 2 protein, partial [Gammaproteobacteria bacterium]|nr:glycosyltransferase family 2 protein [Gammaproteobacteria bacterium]